MKYISVEQAYFMLRDGLGMTTMDSRRRLREILESIPAVEPLDVVRNDTKCWNCDKAYGGCTWSAGFVPVDGWTVIRSDVKTGVDQYSESYIVLDCPQYEKEAEG